MATMELDPKDILKINATIVAGVLILLTVSSFYITVKDENGSTFTVKQIIAAIIIPFAVSSISAIYMTMLNREDTVDGKWYKVASWISKIGMMFGFVYLIGLVYLVAVYVK